jgi:histidine ammonia-lyase
MRSTPRYDKTRSEYVHSALTVDAFAPSKRVAKVSAILREQIAFMRRDCAMDTDVQTACRLIAAGAFAAM